LIDAIICGSGVQAKQLVRSVISRLLNKLLNSVGNTEKQALLINFKHELDNLCQSPTEKRIFNYLDLRLWIDYTKSR